MSLFNSQGMASLTIAQLIDAGTIFGIEASAIRMAVSRLIKEELIASDQRGVYKSGANAMSLNSEIQSWRVADKKIQEWNGDWALAIAGHLGRTNKTQLRSMDKAFNLYGFVEIEATPLAEPTQTVPAKSICPRPKVCIPLFASCAE